ncbi:NAD(P) transhydrogenase subunit alpha [Actinobaculum suis]|uniref:proton-translocating NAD(P)(+) transhydrogenase n=2 Tax=Actinobaculum suis TaxID=1657 RepID=A0A0K9ET25_9ACTO|nr:Re/Si-specific NAD(P)(+) transhydrogenase subunit alpha [Actinobaculum suis]KMY23369.1 NAD(P) transhydrogenase subunit alpha [Actinobaculum suis]MDY5153212.1 Re/Si-specific NAD(P)(+) transhydrogenase subunit alpha [Actinobaculum suis]SDE59609.1 NAD(P) transhydrogenase subunit alpha [Actinobaculum suis]
MVIGIPKSPRADDPLVAGSPQTVARLIKLGYEVRVETGAGLGSAFPDSAYAEQGAQMVSTDEAWAADIVLQTDAPGTEYLDKMKSGSVLIARMNPGANPELIEDLAARKITGLAMDAIPRTSRAQAMDVKSSMQNISGYRAIIEAASHFGRQFTGQVTAAGKMPPATVYVIGAGVAGLAALGTANSMGAIVRATDVRAEAAEQVESMGAEFVEIPVTQESTTGYAKAMSESEAEAAGVVYAREAARADIVITTAQIPGKPAPILLDDAAIAAMQPGSVIVDLAASTGGNTTQTVKGKTVVTPGGVTIIGYEDLARRLPGQSSQLFGQNLVNFFTLVTPERDGQLALNMDDEIVRSITVTLDDTVMWPPPAIEVSAAPAAPKAAAPEAEVAAVEAEPAKPWKKWLAGAVAAAVILWIMFSAPAHMRGHFIVFMLACVVGFYVITAVTHALHTPLMSVTNAISGIIVVGAILQIASGNVAVMILAFIAIVVASINIFGGFVVTDRMLGMFKRS